MITKVDGMELKEKKIKEMTEEPVKEDGSTSINGSMHKITVINANSFRIGDTTKYTPYIRNGLVKNIKIPV